MAATELAHLIDRLFQKFMQKNTAALRCATATCPNREGQVPWHRCIPARTPTTRPLSSVAATRRQSACWVAPCPKAHLRSLCGGVPTQVSADVQ
jgi:hypothetical protein